MAQVSVQIGGRSYALACRDGDEQHLSSLADGLAAKADDLTRSLGAMSEGRLLLMTALMVADELHDMKAGKPRPQPAVEDAALRQRLAALESRAAALATRLGA